jgi:transcriptional regulator with PAS, ATPase and Fis domain
MSEKSKRVSIHQKMEILITELVDNELPLKEVLKEFEKIYIEMSTLKYNGNKTKMAKALGIHRNTLFNLIKALNIK